MPITSHTSRLYVQEGLNSGSPCAGAGGAPPVTASYFQVDTWGPAVTMVSASVTAGTAPPGIAPYVCTGASSSLYMAGTPTTVGHYTYTVDVLMSNGTHNIYNLTQDVVTLTVTSVSPNNGLSIGGTPVTITGTLFEAGATVQFDNVAATSVVYVNSTTITCVTPAHAVGVVNVTVTLSTAEYATLANGYTYTVAGPTGLTPSHGPMAGGTLVTITGNSFEPGMSIKFDGIEATSITYVSSSQYTCVTPEHAAGDVEVTMTGGSHGDFDAGVFTYDPIAGSVWPAGIPGASPVRREPPITIDHTKGAATFSNFDLGNDVTPPEAGQRLQLDLGEGPVLEGVAVAVATTYEEASSQAKRTVTPTDYKWLLDSLRPFGAWDGVSATTVVAEIMDAYAPGFTRTGLQAGLPNVTVTLDGSLSMTDALTVILTAMNVGGAWYLDIKDLHFFQAEAAGLNPATIVDDLETFLKDPPISIVEDVRQIRTRVYGKGQGASVAAPAAVGSTTLAVTSLLPFSKTGGYAIVNGRVIKYAGVATISEAVYRKSAPLGTSFEALAKIISGRVQEGNVRDIPYYKVSAVDAAGVESALSNQSDYIGAAPQFGIGAGTTIPSTTLGYMGNGSYTYVMVQRTSAGTIAVDTFGRRQVQLTLPTERSVDIDSGQPWLSEARIEEVDVYRTKSGADPHLPTTEWFKIATLNPTTPTWNDKLNDDSLSGANPAIVYPVLNNTGIIAELTGIPLGGPGTVSRKVYRATMRNPDVWRFLTAIPDNTTTTLEDNATTPPPDYLDEVISPILAGDGTDDTPGGLPPTIHLVLTGIPSSGDFSINKAIPVGIPVNIWTQVDDIAAQRVLADRLGGDGVRAYTVVDTSLDAANLAARVQAELTLWASPVKTVTWATLDPLAQEGRTQAFNLVHPPLSGSFLIQTVKEDEVHVTTGRATRRTCVASSVRFTLDDLFHKVVQVANGGGGDGGGTVPAQNVGGGSGIDTSSAADGDLLIGRSSDHTVKLAQLTAGAGIVVTPGAASLSVATTAVLPDGSVPFTADQPMGGHKLTNVSDPGAAQDAATKSYVDGAVSGALNPKKVMAYISLRMV